METHLWIDVSKIQVSGGWISNIMRTWCTIIQNCNDREDFLLLSGRATYLFSKRKVFTTTIYIISHYHWTDGFFVKNHPLKEAEKQYKFCFGVKMNKEGGGVDHGVQDRSIQAS